jgi:hypothetical protein
MQVHVFTAERLGDYPYYLCPPCLEALTPYRGRAEVIVEECRMELDTLERQWRANLGKKEG